VTKQMSHGFQIQGAYTYSHSIDDASDPLVAAAGNRTFPRNSLNLRPERGNSDFDIRHRLVINYIYEFPLDATGATCKMASWAASSRVGRFLALLPFQVGCRLTFSAIATVSIRVVGPSQSDWYPRQPSGVDKTFTGPNVAALP